jgi:hypothetical protein
VFFARLPYSNAAEYPATRFIGLGSVVAAGTPAAADKTRKYLHALNLAPLAEVCLCV